MIILIVALVLILGIAFLQMKQGMLSSLIMAVCTVLAGAFAMVTYKQAALATGLYDSMNPLLIDGGFVAILFFAPLFGLRTFTDKFITEDIYYNIVIDRICGGICGIITGITMVGILLVVAQLLPISASIIGYRPYNDSLQRDASIAPFYPDDFVIGLGDMISSNWGGEEEEPAYKEDILRTAFCNRNTADLPCRRDAGKTALKVLGIYKLKAKKFKDVPSNLEENEETQAWVVRVEIDPKESIDEDDWWRLPATQFRMKCDNGGYYFPVGYFFYDQTKNSWELVDTPTPQLAVIRPADAAPAGQGLVIDWVYNIPEKVSPAATKEILPESITFRQTAKADVTIPKRIASFLPGNAETKKLALHVDTEDARKQRARALKQKNR